MLQCLAHLLKRESLRIATGKRGKAVVDVEAAYQGRFDPHISGGGDDTEARAFAAEGKVNGADGGCVINSVSCDRHAAEREQIVVAGVVAVEDGSFGGSQSLV